MATLTKHTSFTSLKKTSSARVKKSAARKKEHVAEMTAFLKLLTKKKAPHRGAFFVP